MVILLSVNCVNVYSQIRDNEVEIRPVEIYDVQLSIVDRWNLEPRVKLAIEGRGEDGWYQLDQIKITE